MPRGAPIAAAPHFPGLLKALPPTSSDRPGHPAPGEPWYRALTSTDPRARVRIQYKLLLRAGRYCQDASGLPPRARDRQSAGAHAFRDVELTPGPNVTSDADIDAHLRRTSTTVSHPVSTCRMGTGENCVLTPDLRVRGIEALRVIDASAFPDLVSAHTNAAVFMLAEKAADLIRGARSLSVRRD